ncbi:MAG: transglutaminase domain-containing protein [Deltaproteobacteria bacterium]|nr:transglutaminase domain-containing protein [Deltaproteobacteria bacterium]
MVRILLCVLLQALLLGPVAAKELSPTDPEIEAALGRLEGVRWYGLYMMGTKMGWVREELHVQEQEIVQTWQAFFQIRVLLQELRTEISHAAWYRRGGGWELLRAEGTLEDKDRSVKASGARVGQRFVVEADSRGQRSRKDWDWPAGSAVELAPWAARERMDIGDRVSYFTVDVTEQERTGQALEYRGERSTGTARSGARVFEFVVHDARGMDIEMVVGENGVVLEGGLGPSVRLVLEDEETAKSLSKSGLDLSLASQVPADRPLKDDALDRVVRLEVVLDGVGPGDLHTDARQTLLEDGGASPVLRIRALDLEDLRRGPGAGPLTRLLPRLVGIRRQPPEPTDPRWIECTGGSGCDHPSVRALAEKEAGGRTGLDLVLHLSRTVNGLLRYELGVSLDRAEEILADGRGDCLEYATLLVALLRARGVPARVVSGVAYASSEPPSFGYHAWAEARVDGHWVQVDPTWDEYPVDATHIVFDLEDGFRMFRHFGRLKIGIRDVEYAP